MLRNARGGGVVVTSGAEPQAVLDELSSEIDRLNKENAALRQRIQLLTHRLFGRRSEKGVPVIEQGVLPFESVVAGPVQPETTDESRRDETSERAPLRRRHPGRRRLPADLPREQIELVPPASERHCATCDTVKVRIGADTTEELDYVPASFVIREYVRPKYACASCQQGVVQAALPARPIEKGRPGAGLLAHVVTSKYADHLPLYRQEQIFERHGVEVTRRIRERSHVPIIVVSARGQEEHKIEALDEGADDYLTKPFVAGELLARVRVALRHARPAQSSFETGIMRVGDVCMDFDHRRVTVRGVEVTLTPIEYRLLGVMVRSEGRILSNRQILRQVWGPRADEQIGYLRVYVKKLRFKIEPEPAHPRYLVNEPGVGYRLRTPD